jgi:hypothetical protein
MQENELYEAEKIIDGLSDPRLLQEVTAVKEIDPLDDLKLEILKFFKNRVASISRADAIKEMAYSQLEGMINAGSLDFDQLMAVIRQVANENNSNADSIMSIFRSQGGQNGGSPLQEMMRTGGDKGELAMAFENMSPEELRKVHQTMMVIRDITERGSTIEVEDGKGVIKD